MLTLAAAPAWLVGVLTVVFLLVCLVLMFVVLIQKPMGGGLAGAFGSGAGSGQTAFGTKTGDALTVLTISLFVLYLLIAIGLNYAVMPARPAPGQAPAVEAPAGTTGAPVPVPAPTPAPTPAPSEAPAGEPTGDPAGAGSEPPK